MFLFFSRVFICFSFCYLVVPLISISEVLEHILRRIRANCGNKIKTTQKKKTTTKYSAYTHIYTHKSYGLGHHEFYMLLTKPYTYIESLCIGLNTSCV